VVKTLLKGLVLILNFNGLYSISLIEAWYSVFHKLCEFNHIFHSLSYTSNHDGIMSLNFSSKNVMCTVKVLSNRIVSFYSDFIFSEFFGLPYNAGIFIRHILM